jgi:hypothetical protein
MFGLTLSEIVHASTDLELLGANLFNQYRSKGVGPLKVELRN